LKRKKENGSSFYALHQNQLLSEVLFLTAWFVSEKLVHPVIWSEKSLRGSAFSASLRLIDLRSEISNLKSCVASSPCRPFTLSPILQVSGEARVFAFNGSEILRSKFALSPARLDSSSLSSAAGV